MDQATLARKAGTSRKWLIEAENGKQGAEIGLIFRTLKALGATVTISDGVAAAQGTPAIDINQIIDALKKPR